MEDNTKNSEGYLNSSLGRESGFSIPTNYFSTIEVAIEAKLTEEQFTKKEGFTIPDSYFKELENDILAKVLSTTKETKVISFKERVLKFIPISAAAAVILFIGINSFVFNTNEELTLDSLSEIDIEYWLDANTLNTYEITIALEDVFLDDNDFYFATLEDKNIEEYINSIDNTSIFEELE
tara:strand:- start:4234 stop:4773 length:540 start_codon:yes stop_codon:yes gene_type:complete